MNNITGREPASKDTERCHSEFHKYPLSADLLETLSLLGYLEPTRELSVQA